MTQETILANATLVLPGEVVQGSAVLRDGAIAEIDSGSGVPKGAVDCGGDYLCPGLIELHTDNLERHITPRPGVHWPHRAAILAHDRELAGAGITTVFDALRVGSIVTPGDSRYGRYARQMADEIAEMRAADALKISHRLHLRAEICSETLTGELDEFAPDDRVGIVSLMDHTPGQRQFRDMAKYEDYVCGKHNLPRAEFPAFVAFRHALQERFGAAHEAAAVAAAGRLGAALASHDDTTAEQVRRSHAHGVAIAEFPTTVAAAETCHAVGIATILGAPNLVRGGSHSGNVAAAELADLDRLDILSSDYVPASLLLAAVMLGRRWGDLARGIATVTAAPARHAGLTDRGVLEAGARADLIRFDLAAGVPSIRSVWCAGRQVA